MGAVVERLTEKDYDEALYVMNTSFSREGAPAEFREKLPIMWTREKDYMQLHFGVREDGKLKAIIGAYPLPVRVAGRELLFSTVGNVGTLPESRGQGFMKMLLAEAMRELDRIGADVSRLGGLRSRYNRFGYDHCGTAYHFRLTARNVGEKPSRAAYTFREIGRDDQAGLDFARFCHRRAGMYAVRRTDTDFYMSCRAWRNRPYLALDAAGKSVGYLCASEDGAAVAEQGVASGSPVDMLAEWLQCRGLEQVNFRLAPYETEAVTDALARCEGWSVSDPSMFKIIHWDTAAEAFLALRAQMAPLPDGEFRLGIEDWGTLTLKVQAGIPYAQRTADAPELTLDRLAAARFLFGPMKLPVANPAAQAWLPLPLSWNGQDRV